MWSVATHSEQHWIEGHEAITLCSTASEQNTLEQAEKALLAVVELLKDPKVAASLQKLSGKQAAEACVLKGNKSKGLVLGGEKNLTLSMYV